MGIASRPMVRNNGVIKKGVATGSRLPSDRRLSRYVFEDYWPAAVAGKSPSPPNTEEATMASL